MSTERPRDRREFTAWNEEMVRRYDPDAYHTRSSLPIRAIERLRVRAIRHLLDAAPHMRVLEVGVGGGNVLERIPGRRVGIDLSPFILHKAHARLGGRAELVRGDAMALPFADGAFDTVVAAWMLYHVPDVGKGLAEIARVLRPGGALVAVTNSVHHLRELRELIAYPTGWEETFSRENGEALMAPHFAHVDRFDMESVVTVREREKLVAYRGSLTVETAPVPDHVELPFVVHGRTTVFVATT